MICISSFMCENMFKFPCTWNSKRKCTNVCFLNTHEDWTEIKFKFVLYLNVITKYKMELRSSYCNWPQVEYKRHYNHNLSIKNCSYSWLVYRIEANRIQSLKLRKVDLKWFGNGNGVWTSLINLVWEGTSQIDLGG